MIFICYHVPVFLIAVQAPTNLVWQRMEFRSKTYRHLDLSDHIAAESISLSGSHFVLAWCVHKNGNVIPTAHDFVEIPTEPLMDIWPKIITKYGAINIMLDLW